MIAWLIAQWFGEEPIERPPLIICLITTGCQFVLFPLERR